MKRNEWAARADADGCQPEELDGRLIHTDRGIFVVIDHEGDRHTADRHVAAEAMVPAEAVQIMPVVERFFFAQTDHIPFSCNGHTPADDLTYGDPDRTGLRRPEIPGRKKRRCHRCGYLEGEHDSRLARMRVNAYCPVCDYHSEQFRSRRPDPRLPRDDRLAAEIARGDREADWDPGRTDQQRKHTKGRKRRG